MKSIFLVFVLALSPLSSFAGGDQVLYTCTTESKIYADSEAGYATKMTVTTPDMKGVLSMSIDNVQTGTSPKSRNVVAADLWITDAASGYVLDGETENGQSMHVSFLENVKTGIGLFAPTYTAKSKIGSQSETVLWQCVSPLDPQ